jgi:hypothetical protein
MLKYEKIIEKMDTELFCEHKFFNFLYYYFLLSSIIIIIHYKEIYYKHIFNTNTRFRIVFTHIL